MDEPLFKATPSEIRFANFVSRPLVPSLGVKVVLFLGGSGGLERSGFSLQNCYRVNFSLKFLEVMNNCMILYAKPALFFLKDRHVQLIVFLRWGGLGLAWLVLALRRVCRTWMPL